MWRRVAALERYALAMDALGAGTWYWDRRTGAVDWDPALEALYGLEEGAFGGRFDDWVACIHPDDREQVLATLEETLDAGGPHLVLYRSVRRDGQLQWIEGRGQEVRDASGAIIGIIGACRDVTEREEAQRERERVLEAERLARERLEFLAEASDTLTRSLDVRDTLRGLASLAVPRLADWCMVDLRDPRQEHLSTVVHADPAKVELARSLRRRFGSVVLDRPVDTPPYDGYLPEVTDGLLRAVARDEEHAEALRDLGLRSAVVVPLRHRNEVVGVLTLAFAESGRRYGRDDYTLARELARRAAIAVDNARLFTERSRIATVLQRALLPPELPVIGGLELASHYETADATDIGGDFFDALGTGDDWTLVVGDVRGKGVEAAALALLARHTVRAAALRDPHPGRVLGVLNDALIEHGSMEGFCTAVCAHLRVGAGRAHVDVAAGGHPAPLLLRARGTLEPVDASGTLVGLFNDCEYAVTRVELGAGDILFFYTDGLTEARHSHEQFGTRRVADALRTATGSAEAAVKNVRERVEAFQAQHRDDVALLALRVLPPSTSSPALTR